MKNRFTLMTFCVAMLSCSSFQKNDTMGQNENIIVSNNINSDTISIKSTAHIIKDLVLILDTLQLDHYNPKSIEYYFGKANEIKIDTSEYGEIIESGSFRMDTHDHTVFEYNENGMIKEFRYEAAGRSDCSNQTNYYYSNNRIDSITTINEYAKASHENGHEKWKQGKICKFIIRYTNEGKLSTLEANDLRNDTITSYKIVYHKPAY